MFFWDNSAYVLLKHLYAVKSFCLQACDFPSRFCEVNPWLSPSFKDLIISDFLLPAPSPQHAAQSLFQYHSHLQWWQGF